MYRGHVDINDWPAFSVFCIFIFFYFIFITVFFPPHISNFLIRYCHSHLSIIEKKSIPYDALAQKVKQFLNKATEIWFVTSLLAMVSKAGIY